MYQRYQPLSARRSERKSKNRLVISLLLAVFLIYALFAWILPIVIGGLSLFKKSPVQNKPVSQADTPVIAPPVLNIPFESTSSAQIKIRGYASPNSQVEIYLDDHLKTTTKTNPGGDFSSDLIDLSLGMNNFYGDTVDSSGNKSLSSKTISVIYDNSKPKLKLDQPQDNQVVADPKLTVSGSTDDSGGISVTINGVRVIISSGGSFAQTISLSSGDNAITVVATNQAGNSTQQVRKVSFLPNTPTPTPTQSTPSPSPTTSQ